MEDTDRAIVISKERQSHIYSGLTDISIYLEKSEIQLMMSKLNF